MNNETREESDFLTSRILGGLWGAAIGDALGVPVEFCAREDRKTDPVTEMRGYGTHHQPPGTWSDDTSLMVCTVDSLVKHDFNLLDMARRFIRWHREGYWTAWGRIFAIGSTTKSALRRLEQGVSPELAGDAGEESNGNGSLMRILPVALRFRDSSPQELLERVHRVSGITHRHPVSLMACGFYCLTITGLLKRMAPGEAYSYAIRTGSEIYDATMPFQTEIGRFTRYLSGHIGDQPESEIGSGGYVVDTLEASTWSFLRSPSYREAVLTAVNLGGDTDTTGSVTGGLAGVHHGISALPEEWLSLISRKDSLEMLFEIFAAKVGTGSQQGPVRIREK